MAPVQARSLLTAHEDFTTLQFHSDAEISRPGYVFTHLKRHLPDEVVEEVKRLSLTADGRSAIFDVPSQHVKVRTTARSGSQHLMQGLFQTASSRARRAWSSELVCGG